MNFKCNRNKVKFLFHISFEGWHSMFLVFTFVRIPFWFSVISFSINIWDERICLFWDIVWNSKFTKPTKSYRVVMWLKELKFLQRSCWKMVIHIVQRGKRCVHLARGENRKFQLASLWQQTSLVFEFPNFPPSGNKQLNLCCIGSIWLNQYKCSYLSERKSRALKT